MEIKVNPHENKRRHNKGMRNLRRLVIDYKINLEIEFIGGRVRN